tara:strand:- start:122 stop:484 length:363 start_codon:yes stop_codon:yes gene_type:complete
MSKTTASKEALLHEEYGIFKKIIRHKSKLSETGPARKQDAFRKFTRFKNRVLAENPQLKDKLPRRYGRQWLVAAAEFMRDKNTATDTDKVKAKAADKSSALVKKKVAAAKATNKAKKPSK